jgi:hypothetical protein
MLKSDLLSRTSTQGEKSIHVHDEFHVLDGLSFGGSKVMATPTRKPVSETFTTLGKLRWSIGGGVAEKKLHFMAYCESDFMMRGTEVIGVVSSARMMA